MENDTGDFRQLTPDEKDSIVGAITPAAALPPFVAKGSTLRFFDPQPDITAYELAEIIGGISVHNWRRMNNDGIIFDDDVWDKLPENIKRHWSID